MFSCYVQQQVTIMRPENISWLRSWPYDQLKNRNKMFFVRQRPTFFPS